MQEAGSVVTNEWRTPRDVIELHCAVTSLDVWGFPTSLR